MKVFRKVNSNVAAYIMADGFYYAGYSVVNAFLSLLVTSKISSDRLDIVGYVIAYYMLVRALAEIPISRLTRRFSFITKRNIIASCYLIYGVLMIFLGHASLLWQVILIQTLTGLLDATAYPIKWPLFTKIIDKGSEELEWSFEDIASTLLPALFTALAGYVSATFGLQYAFIVFALLLFISGLTFFSIKKS